MPLPTVETSSNVVTARKGWLNINISYFNIFQVDDNKT